MSTATVTAPPTATATTREVLETLRRLPPEGAPEAWWDALPPAGWPALFRLLGIAADLPRLASSSALGELAAADWPELAAAAGDVLRLQDLADHPLVPAAARPAPIFAAADPAAAAELAAARAVTVDGFLDGAGREAVERAIAELADERMGTWGELERDQAPDLFALLDGALASEAFHRLTGYRAGRDEYTLTLSLQDLDRQGIGWHRDLYWPREWVGEDVFAVLYGLGDDSPEKGGAFLYHVPARNHLYAVYRRRHQATVLWNGRRAGERPLHAVGGYHGADTSRHLIILQCLRRGG